MNLFLSNPLKVNAWRVRSSVNGGTATSYLTCPCVKSVFSSKNYNERSPDDIRRLTNLARISYDKIVDTQRDAINARALLYQGIVSILLHHIQRRDQNDIPVDDVMFEMSHIPA